MSSSTQHLPSPPRARNVTAVLGPTNTGKTHLAIERMLAHQSGLIGLPLRLLAREVYDRVVARVGADSVALITGEEKIKPERPRFWVATVEAMPRDIEVDFLAIDEIQLAADLERGHVFTERLFHARGQSETLLLGAGTMRETIRELLPGANFVSRPRLSKLTYAGPKKLSRLPRRSAIVAFSAAEVYEIAELIRRQRGGAAVVLGALSPRTRNAQVALYQSGEVDYLVATDAIGMGLNLGVEHVAFAATRKFDGRSHRTLSPGELGQIAGRAGRHMNDGTFGVTGDVEPLESGLIDQLEKHEFEPVKVLQWRSSALEFRSIEALKDSLRSIPDHPRLTRARTADDLFAFESLSSDSTLASLATDRDSVRLLWETCQIPDYRKVAPATHAELIGTIYRFLMHPPGRIPEDWFAGQVAQADRTDGDIDTLANRIAHIRTWTFVSHRTEWLERAEHWQERTRAIEDALSDALHEQLTQRFVDKRTSILMKRMRDTDELSAEIGADGSVHVEKHFVGKLKGFQFAHDTAAEGVHSKAARHAAAQVLEKELAMRTRRLVAAKADALKLTRKGTVSWREEEIARLERSDDPLKPNVVLIIDEHLAPDDRERVKTRIEEWLKAETETRLKPLVELSQAEDVVGLARGIAFRLRENFGIVKREAIAEEMHQLDQQARSQLRKYGLRFGAFNIYFPLLLKPAPIELLLVLWSLWRGERGGSLGSVVGPPRAGLTSVKADPAVTEDFYRVVGYHLCGPRAIRIDILERLADMIRPLVAFKANADNPIMPPKGATGDGGFMVVPEMLSILGCSAGELGDVLRMLGFRNESRPKPAAPEPQAVAADAPPEQSVTAAPAPDAEPSVEAREVETPAETAVTEVRAEAIVAAEPRVADAPAEAAAVEPPGAETPMTAPTEAAAPAEPLMIEIWRPRRRRSEGSESRPDGDSQRPPRHRRERRDHDIPITAPAAAGGTPAASTAPATAAAGPGEQPRREQHRKRRHDDRRPERGGDDMGRRGEWRDNRREEKRTTYDPNSPFAALSALKQKLEQQRDGSS